MWRKHDVRARRARAQSTCETVYANVKSHIEQGFTMLLPPDTCGVDAATKFVQVHLEDELVVITRLGWDSPIARQYRIDRTGNVHRRLIDISDSRSARPCLNDWLWLKRPLTLHRLRYLHHAMQGSVVQNGYSPRCYRRYGRQADYDLAS